MDSHTPQFYQTMKYPTPRQYNLYRYISESQQDKNLTSNFKTRKDFSRDLQTEHMKNYRNFIKEKSSIFKYIPFVSQVYLCNSITFNALHKNSDIDICLICKPWFLRFARARSRLIISINGLKRTQATTGYKFCLSFYIDASHINIHHLRNDDWDIYLSYRLAHCVLLYTDQRYPEDYLRSNNTALLDYLPNHPHHQSISLEIPVQKWNSWFKQSIERISNNRVGKKLQTLLWFIRWKIINRYKTSQLSLHTQKHIIISSTMMKFYADKRSLYQQYRKTRK